MHKTKIEIKNGDELFKDGKLVGFVLFASTIDTLFEDDKQKPMYRDFWSFLLDDLNEQRKAWHGD